MPSEISIAKVLSVAALSVVLAACTKPFSDVQEYVDKTLKVEPPLLEAIPAIKIFPIREYPIGGLRDPGTNYYGLVKDPDGIVHRVQVNNYMGQSYGQILSIAEDKIELEERVKDGSGCERRLQSISLDDNN